MQPFEIEYRRLKEHATKAAGDPQMRDAALREIARHAISELRGFGLSDGALCAWAGLAEFESFNGELPPHREYRHFDSLMKRIWSLAKRCGVVHGKARADVSGTMTSKIYSESFTRAIQSEVWKDTKDFRNAFEQVKNERKKAAFDAKISEWKSATPAPRVIRAATLDEILGWTTKPNKAPEPTP